MPTNENTYNSRVTSEALEAKFRQVFPSQGGAELVDDLYASGVIQPVIDFSSVAEGSVLPEFLQTAWDFSTGTGNVRNNVVTLITNTGFWKVDLTFNADIAGNAAIYISNGLTTRDVWKAQTIATTAGLGISNETSFIVFLRAGDSLIGESSNTQIGMNIWYRQVADVNGNLVNPLGFTFS